MRHRRKGRVLGRSPSHQRALLRNLASALFLTEQEREDLLFGVKVEFSGNVDKLRAGMPITVTLPKAP